MIISYKYKLVFVHIPKTGGESVTYGIKPYLGPKDLWREVSGLNKHSSAFKLRQYISGQGLDWDDFISFSIIRNPWENVYSDYIFHRHRGLMMAGDPEDPKEQNSWIIKCRTAARVTFTEYVKTHHSFKKSFFQYYCQDDAGQDLISRVLPFKPDLQSSVASLCKTVGLPYIVLPRINDMINKDLSSYHRKDLRRNYTRDLIDLVGDVHAYDVKRFGFNFEDAQ